MKSPDSKLVRHLKVKLGDSLPTNLLHKPTVKGALDSPPKKSISAEISPNAYGNFNLAIVIVHSST